MLRSFEHPRPTSHKNHLIMLGDVCEHVAFVCTELLIKSPLRVSLYGPINTVIENNRKSFIFKYINLFEFELQISQYLVLVFQIIFFHEMLLKEGK